MNIGSKSLNKLVYRVQGALNNPSVIGVSIKDIRQCNDVKAYIELLKVYRNFNVHGDCLYFGV